LVAAEQNEQMAQILFLARSPLLEVGEALHIVVSLLEITADQAAVDLAVEVLEETEHPAKETMAGPETGPIQVLEAAVAVVAEQVQPDRLAQLKI
jgi:hypothetical protein